MYINPRDKTDQMHALPHTHSNVNAHLQTRQHSATHEWPVHVSEAVGFLVQPPHVTLQHLQGNLHNSVRYERLQMNDTGVTYDITDCACEGEQ